MNPRTQSILVLTGVFALGGVTGSALTRFAVARHKPDAAPLVIRQKQFIAALDREVTLEDDQRAQVRAIMQEHEPEIREIRHLIGPRIRMLRNTALDEIRHVMRPDQLPRFQRFVDRQDARFHRGDDDGPPDGQDYPGGYPGPGNTGYPGPGNTGYPGPGNTGFPGRPPGR